MLGKIERQLKALANKRRLSIIKFLDKQLEASVGDISDHIKLSFKATSKHLAILLAVEMVDREQRSKTIFYRLVTPKSSLVRQVLALI